MSYKHEKYLELEEEVDNYGQTAAVFWGLGGASLATGIALLIINGLDDGTNMSSMRMDISPTSDSFQATLSWTF